MTGQHDRQDETLTTQIHNQSGHCPLTGRYFEPWLKSSTSTNILKFESFFFLTESYVKLLLSTKDLEKEEDAVEKCLSERVQNCAKFDDHARDNNAQALKSSTDHIINTRDVNLITAAEDSIIIVVECPTLESLERLWADYLTGHLDKVAEQYLVPEEIKNELNLETIHLKTTIEEESYLNCKKALVKILITNSGE